MEENKKEFDESIVEENTSGSSSEEEQQEEVSEETVDEAAAEKRKKNPASPPAGGKKKSARALEIELKKSQEKVADLTDKYQRLMLSLRTPESGLPRSRAACMTWARRKCLPSCFR